MLEHDVYLLTRYLRYKKGKPFKKSDLGMIHRVLRDSTMSPAWWENEIRYFKRDMDFTYYFDLVDKQVVKRQEYLKPRDNRSIAEIAFDAIHKR
jgi:hypothetical protein